MFCKVCGAPSEKPICKHCFRPYYTSDAKNVSHAFEKISEFTPNQDIETLDLIYTNIHEIKWNNLPNLRRVRLARCSKLVSVEITNCPKLESLDLSQCKYLTNVTIVGSDNIKALDLTFDISLSDESFNVPLLKCEYLSLAKSGIEELGDWPSVKYLDLSFTYGTDVSKLVNYKNLQNIHMVNMQNIREIDLGPLTFLPSLKSIDCNIADISFNSFCEDTKLVNLHLPSLRKCKGLPVDKLQNANIVTGKGPFGKEYEEAIPSGDWINSYRMLYGPYAPPPNDIKPIFDIEKVIDFPAGIDPKIASNQICGAIFGSALGDCLGLGGEHMTVQYNIHTLDCPIDIIWTHMRGWDNRKTQMYRGGFTDDTAIAITFMETMCKGKGVFDPVDNGMRTKKWVKEGIVEHRDKRGNGAGGHTSAVVSSYGYDEDPIGTAEGIPCKSNGGVMKAAAAGCFKFWDIDAVAENASKFCRVTHNTDLCAYGSILVSVLVAKYISLRCGLIDKVDIDETIEECLNYVELDEFETELVMTYMSARSFEDLDLLNNYYRNIQTAAVAVFALRKGWGYAEAMEKIIHCGGDSDTNAAVAGAVLGARWGFDMIPMDLIEYFFFGGILMRDIKPFLGLMGLEFNERAWDDKPITFPPEKDTIKDK